MSNKIYKQISSSLWNPLWDTFSISLSNHLVYELIRGFTIMMRPILEKQLKEEMKNDTQNL